MAFKSACYRVRVIPFHSRVTVRRMLLQLVPGACSAKKLHQLRRSLSFTLREVSAARSRKNGQEKGVVRKFPPYLFPSPG